MPLDPFVEMRWIARPGGIVETGDEATIEFDVKGFGLHMAEPELRGSLTGSIRFAADADRYAWLNRVLGVCEGEFFERGGTARCRVHTRMPEVAT